MRRGWLFIVILLWPSMSGAWSLHDHAIIAERGLHATIAAWDLEAPVPVLPFAAFLEAFAPTQGVATTPLAFARYLEIDPAIDIAQLGPSEASGTRTTPLQILTLHVNDPDDGRDANLYRRDAAGRRLLDDDGAPIPLYEHLFFFGGPESQAYRHFEKPPFRWTDIGHTLGYPFGTFGMASVQAQRYFDLAVATWQLGHHYWAWRWLACAIHYVQDISQPYHTTQISSHGKYAWRALRVWLQTPETSLPEAISALMHNSHHWYEHYVAHHTGIALGGAPMDARAMDFLTALDGTTDSAWVPEQGPMGDGLQRFTQWLRDQSNQRAPELLESVYNMSDARLLSTFDFEASDEYVETFLRQSGDGRFVLAEERFFALTTAALKQSAEATRTVVHWFVEHRDPQ